MGFLLKIQDEGGVWRRSFARTKELWKGLEFKRVNLGPAQAPLALDGEGGDHTSVVIAERCPHRVTLMAMLVKLQSPNARGQEGN